MLRKKKESCHTPSTHYDQNRRTLVSRTEPQQYNTKHTPFFKNLKPTIRPKGKNRRGKTWMVLITSLSILSLTWLGKHPLSQQTKHIWIYNMICLTFIHSIDF